MCDQQSFRPTCAYAQSDHSLCLKVEYSMTVKLLIEQHLEALSLKGCFTGSSESTLIEMPHCWKSHVTAHFLFPLSVLLFYRSSGLTFVNVILRRNNVSKLMLL